VGERGRDSEKMERGRAKRCERSPTAPVLEGNRSKTCDHDMRNEAM